MLELYLGSRVETEQGVRQADVLGVGRLNLCDDSSSFQLGVVAMEETVRERSGANVVHTHGCDMIRCEVGRSI